MFYKKLIGIMLVMILTLGFIGILGIPSADIHAFDETKQYEAAVPEGYSLYQNEEYGFQFHYPENWQEVDVADMIVYLESPDTLVNFGVMIESRGSLSFEEWIDGIKAGIVTLSEDAVVSNEQNIEVNGQTGYEFTFSWTLEGLPVKQKVVLIDNNGEVYTLLCSSSESSYDDYADTFTNIIDSFVIE